MVYSRTYCVRINDIHTHMKYADSQLLVIFSSLVSSFLVHGCIAKVITESVIVSVIKDKNRRVNDKGNYRPMCLSNIGSKIVEPVLLNRMDVFLQRTPHQFRFKSKHGTELCVFAFNELLRFYTKHGSAMHVAFLDASKAFDRDNRQKLITKLTQRDVPKYLLRVICNEYNNQTVRVRWGSTYSEFFPVGNGVKQGGTLPPLLFNVYMDELSVQLLTKHSCMQHLLVFILGTTVVNHLIYADDLLLFAPVRD